MNRHLPAEVRQAALPVSYEEAKTALANCDRIDECKSWADKAAALASYAKQANDDSLLKMAQRIQDRALGRAGELLMLVKAQGKRSDLGGAGPLSRKEAAKEAGLSPDQAKDAVRIASVDKDVFNELVESDNPPTPTALAAVGTRHRPGHYPQHPHRDEFMRWWIAAGNLSRLPECGLDAIATHPLAIQFVDDRIADTELARANLKLWLEVLRQVKQEGRP